MRVTVQDRLPREMLGRASTRKKGLFGALSQWWTNPPIPEARDTERYSGGGIRGGTEGAAARVFLQDVPAVLDKYRTAALPEGALPFKTTPTALGYVDVLRVPAPVLEEFVFPNIEPPESRVSVLIGRPVAEDALLEWAVEERFINGTQAMLIDLDRCTRCDDCVRACASTHGGNPRFIRHGKTYDHWMVANACMHCADPVCMIGCPTGAIHRSEAGGVVVINDDTCIGCATCANSCPYDNIRMVEIADLEGHPVVDPESQRPILKAIKCDLCATNPGGPACVRACPHDALRRVDFQEETLLTGDQG